MKWTNTIGRQLMLYPGGGQDKDVHRDTDLITLVSVYLYIMNTTSGLQ